MISYNTKVLRGLNFNSRGEKSRSFLATSPVKLLSSFLGGGSTSENTYATAPKLQRTPLGNVATLFPAQTPQTNQAWFGSGRNRDGSRTAMDEGRPENPLVRLEQTFTGYVASLQGKKGNIVSRMLLNRASTDELAVNDLYNRLIENPFDLDASADVGADVVFAAFEKFLRIAWREQMGPIMSKQALNALQERAIKRVPGDFADFVSYLFSDMAPQNRRAFTAVIKLLADLLDGCGNDGDRGAMTLAFAELLVNDGTAQYYINLLDRLVEDCDRIFDDVGFGSNVHLGGSAYESFSSTARSSKSASGSLTSNTSSLRRKFGFDALLRQNGKGEPDARSSMWRSLSKHGGRNVAGDLASFSSSMSKTGSMNRSRSIDVTSQGIGSIRGRRPGSKDRPPVAGSFDEVQRPASSHRLETIGEPEPSETLSAKKKRRSSLSDLRGLMAATSLDDTPLMPLRINKQTGEKFNSGPRVPPPSRIPVSPTSQNLGSSRQKENIPAQDASEKEQTAPAESDKQTNRAAKTLSMSAIPILKPAQRPGSGGGESPSRPGSSPTRPAPLKTKVQSPQKLRERLQAEKDAVEEADASLKAELSKIGEEMARLGGGDGSGNKGTLPRSTATVDLRRLAASVKALEERIPVVVADMAERHSALQREMEPTIRATEAKVRAIDQLYRETTAENELLYEKFNSELAKIVRALKGKGREDKEELVARLKDASEETARVKKENARLRREMASLRAALKGTSGGSSSGSGGQPS